MPFFFRDGGVGARRRRARFHVLSPMKARFYSAVLNGVVAVPLLVLILLLAMRSSVLKDYRVRGWLLWLGWLTTAVMALCAGAMLLPSN